MDIKELLRGVVDNIINEDEEAAKASFKQYALTKVQGIVEAESLSKKAKKVEDKQKPCPEEEANAQDVIDKSNADD